jgi:dGTPase
MLFSMLKESEGKNKVAMEEEIYLATFELRNFMFERVYNDKTFKEEEKRADRMLTALYEYYFDNTDKLPQNYQNMLLSESKETVLCDYISGMSDIYAVNTFKEIFIPNNWKL